MKKNSLELKKRQHQMLIEQERKEREKRERRAAHKNEKAKEIEELGEIEMKQPKVKFTRGRVLPRREYKAKRRQERLAKYAPRVTSTDSGDIDMDRPKRVTPVSKTLRIVKDRDSIRK
jgi:hypothetical protein